MVECDGKLPELTAVDVGLEEKSYTQEEIDELIRLDQIQQAEEEAMSDPSNWWCGSSWTDMLESCSKRCTTDEDCAPNSWEKGTCFRTVGGPENCSTPGVGVKAPIAPDSRWCGSTWNDMLETCSAKCEADEDCPDGKTCWEAPGTCQWIGVAVKEKVETSSLWCGTTFGDAQTTCTKACPGESDDECPEGMSCFGGSDCVEEGVPVVREGYRCGKTWEDSSTKCGLECQKDEDCTVENGGDEGDICFADVVCAKDMAKAEGGGMFCGKTYEETTCGTECEMDADCPNNQWCYWVECPIASEDDTDTVDGEDVVTTTVANLVGCSAEVSQCPDGQWVARNPGEFNIYYLYILHQKTMLYFPFIVVLIVMFVLLF